MLGVVSVFHHCKVFCLIGLRNFTWIVATLHLEVFASQTLKKQRKVAEMLSTKGYINLGPESNTPVINYLRSVLRSCDEIHRA